MTIIGNLAPTKGRVTYRISYAVHRNEANKITPSTTPTCHIRHSQNFSKIYSFLKPLLNIFFLCNLTVGWGGGY